MLGGASLTCGIRAGGGIGELAWQRPGSRRNPTADALAHAVTLAMRDWWQPTVEGFWQLLPKAGMLHAMSEAKVMAAAPLDSMKKAEAVQMVYEAMQGGA